MSEPSAKPVGAGIAVTRAFTVAQRAVRLIAIGIDGRAMLWPETPETG
jgi:hypothetical protein